MESIERVKISSDRIQLRSARLFSDPKASQLEPFVLRAMRTPEVKSLEIAWWRRAAVFTLSSSSPHEVAMRLADNLEESYPLPDADASLQRCLRQSIHASGRKSLTIHRRGNSFSTWDVRHRHHGCIRLTNSLLIRRKDLCHEVERALVGALGVSRYETRSLSGSVRIFFEPSQISEEYIVDALDDALSAADAGSPDPVEYELALCTGMLGLSTLAQFGMPALMTPSLVLFALCVIPSFREAYHVIRHERRLGVDVLDAIVAVMCVVTRQAFVGAVLAWCLCFGRKLLERTRDDSKKQLLNVFGKQPRSVWVLRGGVELEIPMADLVAGDVIVVNTGETVPVDGRIDEGAAIIDQHVLTGESAPVDKTVGDDVFASTVVVAGKMYVRVERAGSDTTSAQISRILEESAGFTLRSQSRGEALADQMVLPTLALAGAGYLVTGPLGATSIANCDFGTGIRMAAPLALLSSLSVCAERGILVKDGDALETLSKVDTFLFDKTGTLTREIPEIGRIIAVNGFSEDQVLRYAAAAEQKFSHPIARAISERFEVSRQSLPAIDDSQYHVGYGIEVVVDGHRIRVGSGRFIEMAGLEMPALLSEALAYAHDEGHSLVFVAIDDALGGALEIQAALRPEIPDVIAGLRQRGVKHIAIISGDHEKPTRRLAEQLGIDICFAEVLPQDKGAYVDLLRSQGHTVCFLGDGINDSIALQKAHVSVSLRGASAIATDTAQIVFMEENLRRICELSDIAKNLERNVGFSWQLILALNLFCIAGTFLFGFGVLSSVVANNGAAIGALYNGLRPRRLLKDLKSRSSV
ncbi:MAG: heavy metal translocating P-type ATPase [Gammaproteobacteria bacterium]|nr:heavy metal translocating P-type ATPase [Gammaproteobacteria bacterium]